MARKDASEAMTKTTMVGRTVTWQSEEGRKTSKTSLGSWNHDRPGEGLHDAQSGPNAKEDRALADAQSLGEMGMPSLIESDQGCGFSIEEAGKSMIGYTAGATV